MNETKPTQNLILLQWKQDDPATGSYTRHPLDTFDSITSRFVCLKMEVKFFGTPNKIPNGKKGQFLSSFAG